MAEQDLEDDEVRFLQALLSQLTIEMDGIERSQVEEILRDALPDGIRLYDDDIAEAASEAGIDDPSAMMSDLEEAGIIERWTEVSTMAPMGAEGGLDEEKRIEKRMLSVDEDVLDRLMTEL